MSNKINLPIYRAKEVDSDEYVEGYLTKCVESLYIESGSSHCDEIDPTTLSIHFPDMLDIEGNKIFASLSEDGKGGDILQGLNNSIYKFRVFYTNFMIMMTRIDVYLPTALDTRLKKIGIQE